MENVNFGISWVELLCVVADVIEKEETIDHFSEATLDVLLSAIKKYS